MAESSKLPTAWHPPFVVALRAVLSAKAYEIVAELQLNQQPQRIDVVIRLLDAPPPDPGGPLAPLVRHLGPITLVEFKGPSAVLRADDLLVLLGYSYQYRCLHRVLHERPCPRGDLHLMVVADHLTQPFRDAVKDEGGRLVEESPGVHVATGLAYSLCVVETSVVGDGVLAIFSQRMTRRPRDLFASLTPDERVVFRMVYSEVKRFQTDHSLALKYEDTEEMTMSLEELMDEMLDDAPKEKLLKHLSPKDLRKGFSPEDLANQLSPEERLRGLSPEDLQQLSPEARERLKQLLA